MAIVTGDRYLEFLVKFVEKQVGPLLDGTLVLKLNPVGLHYVQSRLEQLQELEGLLAGAPIDYLRAYVSDLGDHRALEQLRRILRLLTSLKVVSVFPPSARDPTPLSLLPFGRLRFLELHGCDLSTSAARGLLELRQTLEKIICHNSTDALRHVFASRIVNIKDSPVWNKLTIVSCACNGLVLMDESLQLLPIVETLDLSRNQFAKVDNLRKCTKLRHLDLGFNHLRTIASLTEVSCPIVKLVLRNNALTTLRGIEHLKSVEGLDLSYNIISSFSELELVAGLSSLQSLWLEGNPVCCARWYRAQVFSFFTYPEKLKLDERGISTRESWKRQIILASRQKRPATYGFYCPAKGEGEEEGSVNAKRRSSRLACIEDEEQRRHCTSEAVDQESLSCDSENPRRFENVISDGEEEIVGLMKRVEFMKKERSVLWLREFREWMDHTSENTVDGSKFTNLVLSRGKEKYMKGRKDHKNIGESSRYVSDSVHDSGDESSTNVLESDISFTDTFAGFHAHEYFNSNGKIALESSTMDVIQESIPVQRIDKTGPKLEQLMTFSHEEHNLLPLVGVNSFPPGRLMVEGADRMDPTVNITPLTAIDEIMESRSSSIHPGSPPHYQEDILHRRHNLEEEFMQLSAESYSVASSDTDTSFTDDDYYKYNTSLTGADQPLNEESMDRNMGNHYDVEESYYDSSHGEQQTRTNSRSSLDSCAEQACFTNQDTVYLENTNQDTVYLDKRRGRWKPKRRVVSLTKENFIVGNTESLYQKLNGFSDFGELDELIKNYFYENLADPSISETCLQYLRCNCILNQRSGGEEIEVAVLLSSEKKLYLLVIDATPNGPGSISKVLGCHRLEDIKEIVIGIGLQVLRLYIEGDAPFLFITRTIEKSRGLLCLMQICDSSESSNGCSLRSWEQVQVKLCEKHICGGLKMSIYLYSMMLFWHKSSEEGLWVSRSLFVIEGYVLVCIEDLAQFSSLTDDTGEASPYFSLDSCCPIRVISEMICLACRYESGVSFSPESAFNPENWRI
ncbi:outer arm dynein light chain 1 protein isoform X2 [Tasmannia lanceolata]|uniref:outer arm dynein light chain 1 protein isoform X2 n=1 Tax=Tasmannia lanceolata TaxID=3420 RepID=UPI0040645FEF